MFMLFQVVSKISYDLPSYLFVKVPPGVFQTYKIRGVCPNDIRSQINHENIFIHSFIFCLLLLLYAFLYFLQLGLQGHQAPLLAQFS